MLCTLHDCSDISCIEVHGLISTGQTVYVHVYNMYVCILHEVCTTAVILDMKSAHACVPPLSLLESSGPVDGGFLPGLSFWFISNNFFIRMYLKKLSFSIRREEYPVKNQPFG